MSWNNRFEDILSAEVDVDNAKTPSGIIAVSISGNGSTAVYNISFLSLTSTSPISIFDLIKKNLLFLNGLRSLLLPLEKWGSPTPVCVYREKDYWDVSRKQLSLLLFLY